MAISNEVVIRHKTGLHARPAALFVKTAAGFSSQVTLENLTRQKVPVNAKSIMSLLTASVQTNDRVRITANPTTSHPLISFAVAVQTNDRVRITANGADEEAAVAALSDLVNNNFGETE